MEIFGLQVSDDTLFQTIVTFLTLIITVYFASYLFDKKRESREIKTRIFSDLLDVMKKYEKIDYLIERWNSSPFQDQKTLELMNTEISEIEKRLINHITEISIDYLHISTIFRVNLKLRFGVYNEWKEAYRTIAKSCETILGNMKTKERISQETISSLKYAAKELTLKYIESAKKGKLRF